MSKKYIRTFSLVTVAILLMCDVFVYLVDPFFHYHTPYFNLEPVIDDEINQNPGMADYFEYDSIILGSSMTQNFTASSFDKVFPEGGKTIKLTYSAIRTGNMNWILSKAHASRKVKNVYLGLDIDPFTDTYGNYYFPISEYLYDDNPFNDVKYVFNKEVILRSLNCIKSNLNGSIPDPDEAYKWEATFSKEEALKSVYWNLTDWPDPVYNSEYIENAKKNFTNNVEPHIANHPETQYYIFLPPYSVLWWNMKLANGTIDNILEVDEYLISELVKYDNVKLFGLQNMTDVTTNLENYKDYNHYSPAINDEIMHIMAGDKYLLTKDNYHEYLSDLKKTIYSFDYAALEKDMASMQNDN